MISFDLTCDELRKQGYTLKKEGKTLALYCNGSYCVRSDILKFWNKTTDKFEAKLSEKGMDRMLIAAVMENIGDNFDKIMTPSEVLSVRQQQLQSNYSTIQMATKATKANCTMKVWQTTLKTKYDNLKKVTEEKTPGL